MISCHEIQERAAYLASLPEADSERMLAVEHARGCSACAQALTEGERVIAMIDQLPQPPPPSRWALQRASEGILRELEGKSLLPSPVRTGAPKRFGVAVPIFAGWAAAVLLAKHRALDRSSWLWSLALLSTALSGLAGIMRFDAAVSAAAIGISAAFSGLIGSDGMLSPALGVKCVLIELFAASLPLATSAFLVATGRAANAPWRLPASAALGALAGQAGLHLTCPARTASPHLLAFHTGGVFLAAMLGLLISRFPAFRLRRERS